MTQNLSYANKKPEPAVPHSVPEPALSGVAGMDWDTLGEAVSACQACRLCERRKQAVLGVGDPHADWMLVGEGPGAEEDARGEPFVGQAGKLLDAMLAAIALKRGENVYIANAVRCPDLLATVRPSLPKSKRAGRIWNARLPS